MFHGKPFQYRAFNICIYSPLEWNIDLKHWLVILIIDNEFQMNCLHSVGAVRFWSMFLFFICFCFVIHIGFQFCLLNLRYLETGIKFDEWRLSVKQLNVLCGQKNSGDLRTILMRNWLFFFLLIFGYAYLLSNKIYLDMNSIECIVIGLPTRRSWGSSRIQCELSSCSISLSADVFITYSVYAPNKYIMYFVRWFI